MRLGRAMAGLAVVALIGGLSWTYFARPSPYEAFRAAVEAAPGCVTAADCTVLQTTCPLGCAHAVPTSAAEALAEAATRYLAQAQRRDGVCAQDCLPPPAVICAAGRCAFAD
jgi:hypothetical protein